MPACDSDENIMKKVSTLVFVFAVLFAGHAIAQTDPLPSWNDGTAKQAGMKFVGEAAQIPPAERIAVFDNDWNTIFAPKK